MDSLQECINLGGDSQQHSQQLLSKIHSKLGKDTELELETVGEHVAQVTSQVLLPAEPESSNVDTNADDDNSLELTRTVILDALDSSQQTVLASDEPAPTSTELESDQQRNDVDENQLDLSGSLYESFYTADGDDDSSN